MTATTPELLVAGAALVVSVRGAAVLADVRARAAGWPLARCGPAVPALLVHDVLAGLIGYALLAAVPLRLLDRSVHVDGASVAVLALALAWLGLAATGRLLRRRQGFPLAALGRPGLLAQEPMLTLRGRLLARVQRSATRAASGWIEGQLESCRRRASATDEQLLPALWAPARTNLRGTVGVGRTEAALLLLQAQSVVDDGSPPHERLLTLLHLVYERSGRRGVRTVLAQAARGPLRHGRSGAPAWGSGPGAIPAPPNASPFPTTS